MIQLKYKDEMGLDRIHTMNAVIFPDKTSQVWYLPEEVFTSTKIHIDWRFEEEREILDLFSLKQLLLVNSCLNWSLHVPFLPYARQDKPIDNKCTFNLYVFAKLINSLEFSKVTAVDVHNPKLTKTLIDRFENIGVNIIHEDLLKKTNADCLVFPDHGAWSRYEDDLYGKHRIIFKKNRDQKTGKIIGHEVETITKVGVHGIPSNFLILDDLCDGGATFISVAQKLKELYPECKMNLFVTHGVFSKGDTPILAAGIRPYTTDSLTKNYNFPEVYKV